MMASEEMPNRFLEALELIGEASRRMRDAGATPPVIVGGAAVEVYTKGKILSRDFDLAVPNQKLMEAELERVGFERTGAMRGLWHPVLKYGVEVVAGTPFKGNYDAQRNMIYKTSGGPVILLSLEDLIADRLGQFDATPYGDQERLTQAIVLYAGAPNVDRVYLGKRILEEAHGRTLEWFEEEVEKRRRPDRGKEHEQ
jgi:hypothetical protein